MSGANYAALTDPMLESAVLGAAQVNDGHARAAALVLTEEHFTSERARAVWRCIAACVGEGLPVNRVSLRAKVEALGLQETVTYGYLCDIDDALPMIVTGFDGWLRILDDKLIRRRIVSQAQSLEVRACDPTQPLDGILQRVAGLAADIGADGGTVGAFDGVGGVINQAGGLDSFFSAEGGGRPIGTGLRAVDALFAGARPGQLVLVAGRTSMGKSALLLQWAWSAAKTGAVVWCYSLEMPREQLVQRLVALEANVSLSDITAGRLSAADRRQIAAAVSRADQTGLKLAYTPAVTTAMIAGSLARAKTKPDLIVCDYLQLIRSGTRASRYEQVSEISRDLKTLAVEFSVPIVAGSQLSRPERNGDERPQLSDLRDSGSLEQDGDVVVFIHGKQAEKLLPVRPIELLVAKQRQGRLGRVELVFDGAHQRFEEPAAANRWDSE